jgi:hypothetical protein
MGTEAEKYFREKNAAKKRGSIIALVLMSPFLVLLGLFIAAALEVGSSS